MSQRAGIFTIIITCTDATSVITMNMHLADPAWGVFVVVPMEEVAHLPQTAMPPTSQKKWDFVKLNQFKINLLLKCQFLLYNISMP